MTWATRQRLTLDPEPVMDASMREFVEVKALRVFGLGDRLVQPGDVVTVSRMRGEYLIFLQLATW